VKPLIASLSQPDEEGLDEIIDRIKSSKQISEEFLHNDELALAYKTAIYKLSGFNIDDEDLDESSDSIYELLYDLYSQSNVNSKRFVLQFIPILVSFYLEYRDNVRPGIEAVLVSIYNQEMVVRKGMELKWTPPKTIAGSIYRRREKVDSKTLRERRSTTTSSGNSALTPNSLKVLDTQTALQLKTVQLEDILPPLNQLSAIDRDKIVHIALTQFNAHLAFMPKFSIQSFLELCINFSLKGIPHNIAFGQNDKEELKMNGFSKSDISLSHSPRINLSIPVMQEIVNGINYCLFKKDETKELAKKALIALHQRASYELATTILISTNALLHILEKDVGKVSDQSPIIPLSETVKQVQEEERKQQEEKRVEELKKKEEEHENNITITPRSKKKKEETKEEESSSGDDDSSDDEEEEKLGRERSNSKGSKNSDDKEKKKKEKKLKKEIQKLAKKEKKERKKHLKDDDKTLHADPNHDPEFSY